MGTVEHFKRVDKCLSRKAVGNFHVFAAVVGVRKILGKLNENINMRSLCF